MVDVMKILAELYLHQHGIDAVVETEPIKKKEEKNVFKEKEDEKRGDIMKYPKPIMSITELTTLGFSRDFLKRCIHIKGFPGTRTSQKGKWMVDTEKFEIWRQHIGK